MGETAGSSFPGRKWAVSIPGQYSSSCRNECLPLEDYLGITAASTVRGSLSGMDQFMEVGVVIKIRGEYLNGIWDGHNRMRSFGVTWRAGSVWGTRQR